MYVDARKLPAVLVVEDEPLIRMDVVDMIEDAGFRTHQADCSDEAIVLMEQHDDIGVLFTDIDMPGTMDGLKLAEFVQGKWPTVVIMIASGAIDLNEATVPKGSLFLPKPYSTVQLMEKLNGITGRLE